MTAKFPPGGVPGAIVEKRIRGITAEQNIRAFSSNWLGNSNGKEKNITYAPSETHVVGIATGIQNEYQSQSQSSPASGLGLRLRLIFPRSLVQACT